MTQDKLLKLIEEHGLTLHGDIEHFAALVAESIVRECIDNLAWHGHDEAARQLDWFLANKIRSER
jgi:hypothetical protein